MNMFYNNNDFDIIRINIKHRSNVVTQNNADKVYLMKVALFEKISGIPFEEWRLKHRFDTTTYALEYLEEHFDIIFRISWDKDTIYIPKSLDGLYEWIIDKLDGVPYKILKKALLQYKKQTKK